MTKLANMVKTEGIHSMRSFSSTELSNNTRDVLAAAAQGPVAINRHGNPLLKRWEFSCVKYVLYNVLRCG